MTQIKTIRGTVTQAYPSKVTSSGKSTPNSLVLDNGSKIACWANKVEIADVHDMLGNKYIFFTSSSSDYNGITTYTCDAFEPLSDTPTIAPVHLAQGDDEPEGDSSSPVVQKYVSRDDSIIRQVAFKEAMNLLIGSGITLNQLVCGLPALQIEDQNFVFTYDDLNHLVDSLFAIAKGAHVPPEPIEIEDEVTPDEEQPGLFPDNNTSPF